MTAYPKGMREARERLWQEFATAVEGAFFYLEGATLQDKEPLLPSQNSKQAIYCCRFHSEKIVRVRKQLVNGLRQNRGVRTLKPPGQNEKHARGFCKN